MVQRWWVSLWVRAGGSDGVGMAVISIFWGSVLKVRPRPPARSFHAHTTLIELHGRLSLPLLFNIFFLLVYSPLYVYFSTDLSCFHAFSFIYNLFNYVTFFMYVSSSCLAFFVFHIPTPFLLLSFFLFVSFTLFWSVDTKPHILQTLRNLVAQKGSRGSWTDFHVWFPETGGSFGNLLRYERVKQHDSATCLFCSIKKDGRNRNQRRLISRVYKPGHLISRNWPCFSVTSLTFFFL